MDGVYLNKFILHTLKNNTEHYMPSYIKPVLFLLILISTMHQANAKIISNGQAISAATFLIATACTKAALDSLIPYNTSIDTAAKSLISMAVGVAGMYYAFSQTTDGKMYHAQNGVDAIFNSQLVQDIKHSYDFFKVNKLIGK